MTCLKGKVMAPDERTMMSVISYFKQVVKDGDLWPHPIVTKLVGLAGAR